MIVKVTLGTTVISSNDIVSEWTLAAVDSLRAIKHEYRRYIRLVMGHIWHVRRVAGGVTAGVINCVPWFIDVMKSAVAASAAATVCS